MHKIKDCYVMFDGYWFVLSSKILHNTAVNKSRKYFWTMEDGRIIKFSYKRPARTICERFLKALDKPLSKDYLRC